MIPDGLKNRQFHKFTGPPENWITAIKFMTWGLEEKHKNQWQNILPGDIFLMHSTSTNTRVKGAMSAVIGFGVVGSKPSIKSSPLWLQEIEGRKNIWPLLVPFSEIYLFSPYFENNTVPEPKTNNVDEITIVAHEILKRSIPLASLSGFPQMGSFSSVRDSVIGQIFGQVGKVFVLGDNKSSNEYTPTPFMPLKSVKDQTRYATSLQTLNEVRSKTFSAKGSSFSKDPLLLERADNAHQETVDRLKSLFEKAGYDTYFNKHVDLYAVKEDKSFLFEVKSNENRNFLPQARKGIVQLFEYEYFEVKKFLEEKKISTDTYKNLTFSQQPKNKSYAEFMNSLELGVTYFDTDSLVSLGRQIGINSI